MLISQSLVAVSPLLEPLNVGGVVHAAHGATHSLVLRYHAPEDHVHVQPFGIQSDVVVLVVVVVVVDVVDVVEVVDVEVVDVVDVEVVDVVDVVVVLQLVGVISTVSGQVTPQEVNGAPYAVELNRRVCGPLHGVSVGSSVSL